MAWELQRLARRGLRHPQAVAYLESVARDLRQRLEAELVAPRSALLDFAEAALLALAQTLEREQPVRERANASLRKLAGGFIERQRSEIAGLVRRVIAQWDAETLSGKLELYVGRDLQYVRVNGTLVGGAVGLLLHAARLAT